MHMPDGSNGRSRGSRQVNETRGKGPCAEHLALGIAGDLLVQTVNVF